MSRILVVDDEPAIGWSLREILADEGHAVDVAATVAEALAVAGRTPPDAILLDVRLPGRDGIDAIPDLQATAPGGAIVVMTAFGDLETAVRAVRAGAFDYLVKPFDLEHVVAVIARAVEPRASATTEDQPETPALVGSSAAMQEVYKRIAAAATDDGPLLITGPAGSGKQLAARAIHAHAARRAGPFVVTSLAALAPAAIARELCGHDDTPGLIEIASGGTLVVEAVEAAPGAVQARLARVIATRELRRDAAARPIDVRLIASSRLPREALPIDPALGELLGSTTLVMPALCDRHDDIEPLARFFLARHAAATRAAVVPRATPEFLAALQGRSWPENVRSLRAAVEHAAVIARGVPLRQEHLPTEDAAEYHEPLHAAMRHVDVAVKDWAAAARAAFGRLPEPDLHNRTIRLIEATLLREALAHAGGNRTAAAKLLGLDRATLRTKFRQLGLDD